MALLDLSNENLTIKYGDKSFELRYPTVLEDFKREEDLKTVEGDTKAIYACHLNFLVGLGGDKTFLESLSLKNLLKILEAISGLNSGK